MEVSNSELNLIGGRRRAVALLLLLANTDREFPRYRSSLLSIKNETSLIAGEAVGHSEDNSTTREKRHGSPIRVEKSDDGESDGDPEPDSRHGSRKKKTVDFHRPDFGVLPAEGFVRLPKILEVVPVSRSTWWAGVKSGRFPAGIKLGAKTTVWPAEIIREVISQLGGVQ